MIETTLASFSAQFTLVDWGVVVGYLAFTTFLGAKLAGKQASVRDFFLGGRKLPWYAVSGSIIATEISAVTFISVPSVVFKTGGNFTYLQLGLIGSLFARIIVGYILVPAYYKKEIYSPYDYMGNQLGGNVRTMTSIIFSIGGILAQSSRVYLTAEVLNVVMRDQLQWLSGNIGLDPLAWAILVIGVVSVGWTLIGGITTVIWTDVILFLVFLLGAVAALITIATKMSGGFGDILNIGYQAKESGCWGKFTFFDFSLSPLRSYTIWTAAIASTWGGLGSYGTDQLLAQRMFCCKSVKDARWAIISSTIGQIVTLTVMFVGVGLFVYYDKNPLDGEALEIFQENHDRIFPIFIVAVIPQFLKGLIIAGVFAAAISSLMGILTALSQVIMSAFYNPFREWQLRKQGIEITLSGDLEGMADKGAASSEEDKRSVFVGRLMVIFWGAVLCGMAYLASTIAQLYPSILDLALAMAGFTGGALLAGFALAFLPLKIDGRGFMWSGPLSVLYVFALVFHYEWTHIVCWAFCLIMLTLWISLLMRESMAICAIAEEVERKKRALALVIRDWPQTVILCIGMALAIWINYYGHFGTEMTKKGLQYITVAWPWYIPIGSSVAFVFGYLLARRRETASN